MLYELKIDCPDQKGLVHKISGILFSHGLNMVENEDWIVDVTTERARDVCARADLAASRDRLAARAGGAGGLRGGGGGGGGGAGHPSAAADGCAVPAGRGDAPAGADDALRGHARVHAGHADRATHTGAVP